MDADEQRQQYLEQRKADQQQKRRESAEAEKKERLETCIRVINDKGGQISRKQLTEILTNMLKRKRPTVSAYITEWINDKHVFEADGIITLSAENIIPF